MYHPLEGAEHRTNLQVKFTRNSRPNNFFMEKHSGIDTETKLDDLRVLDLNFRLLVRYITCIHMW